MATKTYFLATAERTVWIAFTQTMAKVTLVLARAFRMAGRPSALRGSITISTAGLTCLWQMGPTAFAPITAFGTMPVKADLSGPPSNNLEWVPLHFLAPRWRRTLTEMADQR